MIFSFLELKKLARLKASVTIEKVIDAFNAIGFEVENYWKLNQNLKIQYGQIIKLFANPQADKLNVCEIQFSDRKRVIQTTSKNLKLNDKVIVFLPGTILNEVLLETKMMKGIISEGMLASLNELGFKRELLRKEDLNNILVVDQKTKLSADPYKDLDLDDYLIDLSILPNRSDANSYLVMAQELGAYFGTLKAWNLKVPNLKIWENLKINNHNYAKQLVLMKTKKMQKLTLKERLLVIKSGFKSVNDWEDLANWVLIMSSKAIQIYNANELANELTLEYSSQTIEINKQKIALRKNLVTKSQQKILSLAGVWQSPKVKTPNIENAELVFEIAKFKNKDVFENMRLTKINTKSAQQHYKDSSWGSLQLAVATLAQKLPAEILISKSIFLPQRSIAFQKKAILDYINVANNDLGLFAKAFDALKILGFEFVKDRVYIPNYRYDINLEVDIIEEIIRFYGLNQIQAEKADAYPSVYTEEHAFNKLHQQMPALGYQEVKTYTLISLQKNDFNPFAVENQFQLQTFISKEREVIRFSALNSFLEIIDFNYKRGLNEIEIYELGNINYSQEVLIMASNIQSLNSFQKTIFNLLPLKNYQIVPFENIKFLPNHSFKIVYEGKMIGYFARLNPNLHPLDIVFAEIESQYFEPQQKAFKSGFDRAPLQTWDYNFLVASQKDYLKLVNLLNQNEIIYDWKLIDKYITTEKTVITIRFWLAFKKHQQFLNELNKMPYLEK